MSWAERTNECLIERTVAHAVAGRSLQCSNVDVMMRADLHACTQLTNAAACRQLLMLQRRDTLRLFTHMSVSLTIVVTASWT